MRKTLLASVAALALTVGSTVPAMADDPASTSVDVFAWVDYDKNKHVRTFVYKEKHVAVLVFGKFKGHTGAEADAVVNQKNVDNYVDGTWEALVAKLEGSVSENVGITQVNQDVGYNVNQSNVLSAAVSKNAFFADANAAVQQTNAGNFAYGEYAFKRAEISQSVNRNVGVTMVNQNAGVMNNQNNTVSLGIGKDATVALAETDLGQFNSYNTVADFATGRTTTITGSVNHNTGITAVNQSTGNMNNQSTNISISGAVKF